MLRATSLLVAGSIFLSGLRRPPLAAILDKLFARRVAVRVYGLGAVAIGLVGLVWGDFLAVWQPAPKSIPGRTALAYLVAVIFLAAGAGLQIRRSARAAAVTLTVLYGLGVLLLHLRRSLHTRQ